ncbi:MAG: hypothetical protein H6974_12950 [Gammaproteobacteria bacterium]|nr:hypothetical protein [Gammaproteobacteria bacterium]
MITLDMRGLPEMQHMLQNLAQEQLPFAISAALNSTAFAVQKASRRRLETAFDRPTPLIKGATRVEKATKQNLTARVFIDPKRAGVLKTHEQGGPRGDQRLEKFLRGQGWLPAGWRAVPTDYLPLNRYGNPRQAEVTKIINGLPRAGGIKGDARRHFVIKPGSSTRLSPGIYRTRSRSSGAALLKLYHFASHAQYQARLDWLPTVEAEARRLLPEQMQRAIQRAIETAR